MHVRTRLFMGVLGVLMLFIGSAPLSASANVSDNLLAHWRMDEGAGTTTASATGLFNGTLVSTPTWVSGKFGAALSFNGTDYVQIGTIASINATNAVTLTAWVKRTATSTRVVFGKQGGSGHNLAIDATANNWVVLRVSNGSAAYGRFQLNDTQWHHIALVFDGSQTGNANRLKGYADGVQKTLSFSGTIPALTTANTAAFTLGRMQSNYSNGSIDDARVYNRALSAADVAELAGQGVTPTVSLSASPASVFAGATSTLTWSSSNATNCFAGGDWNGTKALSGSEAVFPTATSVYTLACANAYGTTTANATITVTIPDTEAPSVPTNLAFTSVTSNSIALSWNPSTDNTAVTGYRVFRNSAQIATTSATTFTNTGLTPETLYSYTVAAYDAAGNVSAESTPIATTTPAIPPAFSWVNMSGDGKYLVNQYGQPYFINGDTPWSLIANTTIEDAELYITNRAQKGVNAIIVNLIEHAFAQNAPNNSYNVAPFTTPGDFTTPNEAYFAHADAVIQKAQENGITVFLAPLYVGAGCGSEGWCSEITSSSLAEIRAWGQYVGNRYRNYPNIVWLIGGDSNPFAASGLSTRIEEFVAGVKDVDDVHLMTFHGGGGDTAINQWPNTEWLDINNIYTYTDAYPMALQEYNRSATTFKPFFLLETGYENEGVTTPLSMRRQAYQTVLSGGYLGHFMGICPIWSFDGPRCGFSDWRTQLDTTGAMTVPQIGKLAASRTFHTLVPDQTHVVMTGGFSSGNAYAPTARTANGETVIAYIPTSRTVTMDMTKVGGTQANAWWFNPRTASSTFIGTFPTTGTQQFTSPDSNDWVLVLDNAALGLSAPGTTGPAIPSVSLAANPSTVLQGASTTLTWNSSNATSCEASGGWTGTKAVSGSEVSGNVLANTSYTLVCSGAGGSATSTASVTVIIPDTEAPTVPQNLTATASSSSNITLSWNPSTDNTAVTGYHVFRNSILIATTTFVSFSDIGLSANTLYSYTVTAFDAAANESTQSTPASATTLPPQAPTASLSANPLLIAFMGSTTLSWNSTDATSCEASGGWSGAKSVSGTQTMSGLAATTTFVLECSGAGGSATSSVTVGVTPPDTQAPSIPQNVQATASSTSQIVVNWSASTDNTAVTGYHVFRNDVLIATTTNTLLIDTGLTASTTYSYTVTAFDAAGNESAPSSAAVATTPSIPALPTEGLVAYLALDETSGTTAADASGNAHTGTLVNTPTWVAGKYGNAIQFNGSSNYVDIADESAFDFTGAMSASFWMKTNGYNNDWAAMITKGDSAWGVARNGGGSSVTFTTFNSGGVNDLFATAAVQNNQWHHVVVVYTGTQKLVYIDGVQNASVSYSQAIRTNNLNVRLGMNQEYAPAYYGGALDEVRVYNRALTATEVTALFNQ